MVRACILQLYLRIIMGQTREYYTARLAEFVEKPYRLQIWFIEGGRDRSVSEIVDFYQVIKKMWFTHRCLFSSKGQYKELRRRFIKFSTRCFMNRCYLCAELPGDLCKEILDKVNQDWISPMYEVDESMWRILLKKSEGYTGNKTYPPHR